MFESVVLAMEDEEGFDNRIFLVQLASLVASFLMLFLSFLPAYTTSMMISNGSDNSILLRMLGPDNSSDSPDGATEESSHGPVKTADATETIEVWANTSIGLSYENGTATATLLMDNGSVVPGHEVSLYLDGAFVGMNETDSKGTMSIDMGVQSGKHVIKAVFPGDPGLYLNPSHEELETSAERPESEAWLEVNLELPEDVKRGEDLAISAIASGFNTSNITLAVSLPDDFIIISGNGTVFCASADSCTNEIAVSSNNSSIGEKEVTATASSDKMNATETKTARVFADTSMAISLNRTKFYQNDSMHARATLLLDNSSPLANQGIDFYLDGVLIGSDVTAYGEAGMDSGGCV